MVAEFGLKTSRDLTLSQEAFDLLCDPAISKVSFRNLKTFFFAMNNLVFAWMI